MLNIKQRQLNLRTYYYIYKGSIDGIVGSQTVEAYKDFQSMVGITVDGIYGVVTDEKLVGVLKDIQVKLNNKGYNLVVDGIVGNETESAIKDFQGKNNINVTGIIDSITMEKLDSQIPIDDWSNIKNFKKEEFYCKDGCGLNNIDINFVKILDEIRDHFGKPLIVTSGCRCKKHNNLVGGTKNSKHLSGKAADFVINGVSPADILNYTNMLVKKGIINHTYGRTINMGNAVHIDIK